MDLDALSRGALLVLGLGQEGREASRGTAFAVDEGGLVVTAAHVVEGFTECLIVQGEPSGEHWGARGTVLQADKLADVAIIRTETQPPHLFSLNLQRTPTSSDHLVVRDWPDWQGRSKPLLQRHARAR